MHKNTEILKESKYCIRYILSTLRDEPVRIIKNDCGMVKKTFDDKYDVEVIDSEDSKLIESSIFKGRKLNFCEEVFVRNSKMRVAELDKEFLDGINDIFSELGTLSKCDLIIDFQSVNQMFFQKDYRENNIEYIAITMQVEIYINGKLFNIEKSEIFKPCNYSNIRECIENFCKETAKVYLPYKNREIIKLAQQKAHVVLPAGVGGLFIHKTIGYCLEADLFMDKDSILYNKMGEKIAASNVTVLDTCNKNDYIQYDYSADGTSPKTVELLKNGVVNGVLSDRYTAQKYKIPDSGNGRAESYNKNVIPRMRNTFLECGNDDVIDAIRNIEHGIYALEIGDGSVDTKTGNFRFIVNHGLIIHKGELTNLCTSFVITGNVLSAFNQIDFVCNDIKHRAASYAKGGQKIDISYGSPTFALRSQYINYC